MPQHHARWIFRWIFEAAADRRRWANSVQSGRYQSDSGSKCGTSVPVPSRYSLCNFARASSAPRREARRRRARESATAPSAGDAPAAPAVPMPKGEAALRIAWGCQPATPARNLKYNTPSTSSSSPPQVPTMRRVEYPSHTQLPERLSRAPPQPMATAHIQLPKPPPKQSSATLPLRESPSAFAKPYTRELGHRTRDELAHPADRRHRRPVDSLRGLWLLRRHRRTLHGKKGAER